MSNVPRIGLGKFAALAVVLSVLYLGIFGSAIAFVIYYSLLKEMSAVSLSSIIYITPLIAIVTGWLLLDEAITLRIAAGTLIIFGGIAMSQFKRREIVNRS